MGKPTPHEVEDVVHQRFPVVIRPTAVMAGEKRGLCVVLHWGLQSSAVRPIRHRADGPISRAPPAQRRCVELTSLVGRTLRTPVLAGILAVTLYATTVSPAQAIPMPVNSLTPAAGSTTPYGAQLSFEIRTEAQYVGTIVEVATRNIAGQDGSLADDFVVSRTKMTERDSAPGTYFGTTSGNWVTFPGVYFVQFSALRIASACPGQVSSDGVCHYESPVYQYGVAAPPGPAPAPAPDPEITESDFLTRADAVAKYRSFARRTLRARTIKSASCKRVDNAMFRCFVRFTYRKNARSKTVVRRRTHEVYAEGERLFVQSY